MLSPLLKKTGLPGSSPSSVSTQATKLAVSPSMGGQHKEHEAAIIRLLPPELLAHIFALLPAGSLLAATVVCRVWHHVATDEASWRSAFINYYGLPESGYTPARRLDHTSWRAEYLLRTRLVRRWTKSRNAPISFDARAGLISDLVVSMTDAMCLSTEAAGASRTDPLTGRILRTNIHPGTLPGQLTCTKANEKGSAIAWGLRDGEIRVSLVCAPVSRPLDLAHLGDEITRHQGPVTCLSFAPYVGATTPSKLTLASTAADGLLKIWDLEVDDPARACLFSSNPLDRIRRSADGGQVDVGLSISYSPSYRVAAVGTEGGALHVWRLDGQWSLRSHVRIPPLQGAMSPISMINIDACSSAQDISILIKRIGGSTFERHWPFAEPVRPPVIYANEGGTALKALVADFAPPKGARDTAPSFGSFKYVIAGDEEGTVAMWMWDTLGSGATVDKDVQPHKVLQKRTGGLPVVTAVALSDLLVYVGSVDGSIRAYDPLTGQLVRALADRSNPRQTIRALAAGLGTNEEQERYAISHLRASRGAVIASAGSRVIAWHVNEPKGKRKKRKLRVSSANRGASGRADRLSDDREIQQDVYEIRQQLREEQEARLERSHENARLRSVNGAGILGLSEEEAIAYAMMLSADEADAAATTLADDMAALQFDFEQNERSAVPDEDDTALLTPARSSLLSNSMRSSRGSSRSSTASLTDYGDSLLGEDDEDDDDFESFVGSPASIASNRYFPLSPRVRPQNLPDLADDSAWPSPSPRSPLLSPAHASRFPSLPTPPSASSRRSFSDAARAGMSSPLGESPRGLCFGVPSPGPSPSLRPVRPIASGPDADLQFAIELSLAEARSKLDQTSD